MSDAWREHDQAKHAAISQVSDFMIAVMELENRAREVADTVAGVTGGENCPNDNGRAAWESISSVTEELEKIRGLCVETITQLDAYIF